MAKMCISQLDRATWRGLRIRGFHGDLGMRRRTRAFKDVFIYIIYLYDITMFVFLCLYIKMQG